MKAFGGLIFVTILVVHYAFGILDVTEKQSPAH